MQEHADLWEGGTYSRAEMMAYKAAEAEGMIHKLRVEIGLRTDRMLVRYASDLTHGEVRKWLAGRLEGGR